MKGRRTSFQRFGSMVGVQGSVLNKWPRGTDVSRDMDTDSSKNEPTDQSDGKGIYNITIKSSEDLVYTQSDADKGEEVYGCLTSGYTNGQDLIEHSADVAIDNRRQRKDYEDGKGHFSATGRYWAGGKDSACIPTENVPLVANSKFEIKYWDPANGNTTIPKGAGFTSGALVRPIAFSSKAAKIPDGSLTFFDKVSFLGHRAHTLSGVPIKIAHSILNRCKEISLTGSVDYSITRTSKKCEGENSTTKTWTSQSGPSGCPPGTCQDTSGSITVTCASTKQTTKVNLSGNIGLTAFRHKQVADLWKNPKTLDISGNYFFGSQDNISLRKYSYPFCDASSDSIAPSLPDPTIEKISDIERQTKLGSGCLVYPFTNKSIMAQTEEENLKTKQISVDGCTEASIAYSLTIYDYYNYYGTFYGSYGYTYPGGAFRSQTISPVLTSGPSLYAVFNGNGWDFSELGLNGPEKLYSIPECGEGYAQFYDYKMKWNSTGIKKTIVSGDCDQGLSGLGKYGGTPAGECLCDSGCGPCTPSYGTLKLHCECQSKCITKENACNGERKSGCDGTYAVSMYIGKSVGLKI
ncbi:MAG: hypothetical protein EBU08_13250, partial [Micrococcales bacterium]|nr:hypothetical protein [Micrococcales bacterium]